MKETFAEASQEQVRGQECPDCIRKLAFCDVKSNEEGMKLINDNCKDVCKSGVDQYLPQIIEGVAADLRLKLDEKYKEAILNGENNN